MFCNDVFYRSAGNGEVSQASKAETVNFVAKKYN